MKIRKDIVKNKLKEQKKIYLSIIIIAVISLIIGIIYQTILSVSDHTLVENSLNTFFSDIKSSNLDYSSFLINSLTGNLLFIIFVWLLGISVIGIPIIYLLVFLKLFIFGFSISAIIETYHLKGILRAITYVFPHQLVFVLVIIFLSFYSVYFSKRLFNYLFLKKDISLKHAMKRYLQVLLICVVGSVLCSLFEVFLSPSIIKLFL